jgi:predicted small metal-binding protein
MERKMMDCRMQKEVDCSLTISGTEDEVIRTATQHAVAVHGLSDSPQLKEKVRSMLQPERSTSAEKGRKVADCRRMPSERACSLTISGRPAEVVETAVAHAVADHGHDYSPKLREQVGKLLQDERRA